jgi:methyltransferase-like protein
MALHLLTLLDGTRDRAALASAMREAIASGAVAEDGVRAPDDLEAAIDQAVRRLARAGLLVQPGLPSALRRT